jgi:hypothetical protein
MAIIYKPLIHLSLLHEYYLDHKMGLKDFFILPAPETAALFRRFDLRLRVNDREIVVYYRIRNQMTPVLDLLRQSGSKLTFILRLKNNFFYNHTLLPDTLNSKAFNTNHYLYCFDNLLKQVGSEPDTFSLNSAEEGATATTFSLNASALLTDSKPSVRRNDLTIKSNFFSFHPDLKPPLEVTEAENEQALKEALKKEISRRIEVKNAFDKKMPDGLVNRGKVIWDNAKKQWVLSREEARKKGLIFEDYPSGKYKLEIEGQPPVFVYHLADKPHIQNFGVIDFFLGLTEQSPSPFLEAPQTIIPRKYELRFARRATTWRYFFIMPKKESVSLKIKEKENVQFEAVEKEAGEWNQKWDQIYQPDKEKLLLFKSNKEIAIEENASPEAFFKIEEINGQSKERDLPRPGIHQVSAESIIRKNNGESTFEVKYYSDLFIYL